MAARKIGSFCFVITGEYIANTARTLVVEGRWRTAVDMLYKDLPGITMDQVYAILRGDSTLNGDSNEGVDIEPWSGEERDEYNQRCAEMFGHLLYKGDTAYTPEYIIEEFQMCKRWIGSNFEDIAKVEDDRVTGIAPELVAGFWNAGDASLWDFTKIKGRPVLVGWKETTDIMPPWFEKNTDPERSATEGSFRAHYLTEINVRPRFVNMIEDWMDTQKELRRREGLVHVQSDIWAANGLATVEIMGRKIPEKPLLAWGLRNEPNPPKWKPISKMGEKMSNDNPIHTDWAIGAGIDPYEYYTKFKDFDDAVHSYIFDYIQVQKGNRMLALVKCRESVVTDRIQVIDHADELVQSNIVVIPDASTRYIKIARQVGKRGGIILTQQGSKMSHLVCKGEDYGITIYHHPEANKFADGSKMTINPTGEYINE